MISATINQKIAEALKSGDKVKLSTLRMLSSALNYEIISKRRDLTEEEEFVVVRKEIKKRNEAIEAYEKVNALNRAETEKKELAILKEFLPEDIADEELQKIVEIAIKETGVTDIRNMGKVIGTVMQKTKGQADGRKVVELVKTKLSAGK